MAYAGGWPHSALYAVRLTSLTEAPSASAKRVTASERDVQFGYCGLSGLLTNQTGERERSLIAGSYYGVMYYYRNMADSGIAFRGRVPLVDNTGASRRFLWVLGVDLVQFEAGCGGRGEWFRSSPACMRDVKERSTTLYIPSAFPC